MNDMPGMAGMKALGGAAAGLGIGAVFASIVVMSMTLPKTVREWTVALISTVFGSLGGGSYVIVHWQLLATLTAPDDLTRMLQMFTILGIAFTCGLPAWALVRAVFLYIERNRDKDIGQVADDIKAKL